MGTIICPLNASANTYLVVRRYCEVSNHSGMNNRGLRLEKFGSFIHQRVWCLDCMIDTAITGVPDMYLGL